MPFDGTAVFEGYRIYGPRLHEKQQRKYIVAVKGNKRICITYAKYLMCMKENRLLKATEIVDHINNCKLDDRIENLQIVSNFISLRKGRIQSKLEFNCTQCGQQFERRKGTEPKGKPFCTKRCHYLNMIK